MANDTGISQAILIIVAAIVLLPLLMMTFAFPMMGMWGGGHMWDSGAWNGAGTTWMWLLNWFIFPVIIVGVGYFLYRAFTRSEGSDSDPALEELRSAYARGELSDEEFENRRERLQRDR